MSRFFTFAFLILFSCTSFAQDWRHISWQSGQILGISSRAGLTPVVVQLGTLSQVDHVAVVSVEADGPWIYEFTNESGIQKIKLSEAWTRAADRNNNVHFVVGELVPALKPAEWLAVTARLDSWVSRKDPTPPSNCIETVLKAYQGIRPLHVRMTSALAFAESIGALPLLRALQKTYPDFKRTPVIASLFEKLHKAESNISESMMWSNEKAFISNWKSEGDASKFVRSTGLDIQEFAASVQTKRTTPTLRPYCEALF